MIDPYTDELVTYPIIVIHDADSAADALRLAATLIEKHYPGPGVTWGLTGVELEVHASENLSREAWRATVLSMEPPEPLIHMATVLE